MKRFFEIIHENKNLNKLVYLVATSGKFLGEYALYSDDNLLYKNGDNVDWLEIITQFNKINITSKITVDHSDFFCEVLSESPNLVICGAGHVSVPIIKIAKMLKFNVTAIDDRPTFTTNAQLAGADAVICNNFKDALDSLPNYTNCYYIVVTRGHRYDKDCLKKILNRNNRYVGVMSSKARVAILKRDMSDDGVEQSQIDAIKSPIGLNINSETPEEIAVSIMAQIIMLKNQYKPSFGFPDEFLDQLAKSEGVKSALCTIVSRRGSAPREVGSKMIVREDGVCIDTIGGGCVEAEIRNIALDVIRNNHAEITQSNMTIQQAEDEGMVCGGIIDVLIQPID